MLYDQFNGMGANNGVGPPNPQATSGAPGFNTGSWGNLPSNLAGGLQAFMAARGGGVGAPNPGMMPARPPIGAQQGIFGGPNPAMPPGALPGTLSPGVAGGTVPGPGVVSPGMAGGTPPSGMPPVNGASMSNTGMPTNFAGGMRPYLGN